MPTYQAYGLRIESAIELPELAQSGDSAPAGDGAGQADVVVRCRAIDRNQVVAEDAIGIHYRGVLSILISGGKAIDLDIEAGIDPRIVRLILLGPGLGLLLHQRGYLVLHASAVQVGGKAVAFAGDKGAGKSTTAGAFGIHGHALLADDILAIAPRTHRVFPGFAQLKLWREAAEHLTENPGQFLRVHPEIDKLAVGVPEQLGKSPCELGRIYVLSDGDKIAIEPIPPQQAFMEIVKNSYAISFLKYTNTSRSHFEQAVALAAAIPIRRLMRPRSLPLLGDLVSAVVADGA